MKLSFKTSIFHSFLFFLVLFSCAVHSQTVSFGFNIGSSQQDYAQNGTVDALGNVYSVGAFRGTNVDFDPSAATALRTSNGLQDGFLAKYNSVGQFQFCITIGGADLDKVENVTTDAAGNVYIAGFFRGANVDFDPSAATFLMSSNGDAGGDPGYGGDLFVAKYTSTGAFIWAFHVGGSQLSDNAICITADGSGGVYVGGYFHETADFDPSPATAILNGASGTAYIARYNASGQYLWAFNFGIESSLFDIEVDAGGNVYFTGYFQGTNIDFDPSAATAPLTSAGAFDIFLAKFNAAGQYQFAFRIGSSIGSDVGRALTLDNSGNVYMVGDFLGTNIDFDPSAATALRSSNGSSDVFIAKYTSTGQYVWATNAGSGGGEYGWGIDNDGASIFITGGFTITADFDPGPNVENLSSNGLFDMFLAKYDLNGNYQCAFRAGGPGDDIGAGIRCMGMDNIFLTGTITGTNTDMDPLAGTFPLSSNGVEDIFLVKYNWPSGTPPAGTLQGSTICAGNAAQLTFNATTGTGPFQLTISNGTNTFVQTNVQSGVPFNIIPAPTSTTTYTLVGIKDAARCSPTSSPLTTAVVTVNQCPGSFCDSWLRLPSQGSYVTTGDIDVSGTQLTVEAMINRQSPLNSGIYWGHLVSKHTDATNVNYALLPNGCEITTTNGYKGLFPTCQLTTDKTYHVAMVYDGATLKFYRNGYLVAQTPCTGNIINNNLLTKIGQVAGASMPTDNQALGYMNEVRIWNVARTQAEIRASMNGPLGGDPTTTPGLLAYYSFNNLINKQGNAAFNGTLSGGALLAQTNPVCTVSQDSCNLVVAPACPGSQLSIGTPAYERAYDVVPTSDGYYMAGVTRASGNDDIIVTKLDFNNNIVWSKQFGGSGNEFVRKIAIASDGGVLITGQTKSAGNPTGDILALKVSPAGTLVWARKFGLNTPNGDLGMDIIETSDGGYAISGIINVNGGVADAVVIKLNNALTAQWIQRYDRGDGEDGVGILQKGDTLIVSVDLQNSVGHYENLMMKLRMSDGAVVGARKLTPAARGLFNGYLFNNPSQPGYILSGHTIDNSSYANMKHTILTLDENFNVLRTRLINVTPLTNDFFTGLVPLADGGFIGVASPQNSPDAYVYRVNNTNNIVYSKKINASGDRRFQRVAMSGQNVIAVGSAVESGNENLFYTNFNALNPPSDWCDMENTTITIETPAYTTSAFTWPTISSPVFPSTTLGLGLSDISLQTTDLCPCLRDTIINDYTPALSLDVCKNILAVSDASKFAAGDTVLLIQMKGATVDVTNTAAFGNVTDYRNSGNYEFNYIKSITGNNIELLNVVERQYNFTDGKVQLITVPYYQDVTITDRLTCLPWDGNKGGVLVFNVQNAITMSGGGRMDVSGRGFKGGNSANTGQLVTNCFTNNYFYPSASTIAATKGESITTLLPAFANGKGAAASAGGGGLDHNSGGGGGGNGGVGGFGGYQLEPCGSAPFDNRGIGGRSIPYSNAANKIFMGGGGGAGHANNPANISQPSYGANGGGIIIVSANTLQGASTNYVISNGADAPGCTGSDCHDGMGGGGAGGTVLLNIANVASSTTVNVRGGKGANVTGSVPAAGRIGPGGGGAGGVVWTSAAAMPPTITVNAVGGANGVLTTDADNPWGATTGANGISVTQLQLPVDDVLFKPNIDSVRYNSLMNACNIFNFEGLAYVNTNPVATWQWSFGDNTFANTQNASHTYATGGTYPVKLVVTDINGCKDSITKNVMVDVLNFDFSYQQDICNPLSIQFTGTGTTVSNPYWLFGDNTTATILNPSHLYTAQGTYTVQYSVTGANGCSDTITKVIPILIVRDDVVLTRDTTICAGTTKQLLSVPALAYCWTPSTYLSNPNIQNPITSTPGTITYFLTTETQGTNLVVNGNFTAGNTGFTSQYVYTTPNVTEAQYYVSANASAWNGAMQNCPDHTTGTGNMMLVNGSPNANDRIWSQTITVTPNTNYAFATWIQSLNSVNPARLKFSINNTVIGNNIDASATPCQWNRFYTTWNSGNSTTATITIVNNNTVALGNDFALDDISFSEVMIKRDSVIITVDTPGVRTTDDLAVCPGTPVQLNTTGAQTYVWNASSTLSNVNIPNPVATPTANTQYIVTGTNANGCVAKDTVNINVHTRPTITVTDDAQICRNSTIQLSATGGLSYLWTPPATLDNPTSSTPIATPTADTWYYVNVTDNNTCTWRDSVLVTLRPEPIFTVTPATSSICAGQSVQLHAAGGTSYSWSPSTNMDDPTSANPTVTPTATTTYSVTVSEGTCNRSQILSVTVNVEKPVVITNDNTTICKGTSIQFNTTGAQNYSWNQPGSLSSPSIPNPVATPTAPTQYIVTGTTATGCSAKDTVNIDFYPAPLITTTDDADICRNGSIQLSTTGGGSYTWTPAATLNNPSVANPVATPTANTMYYVDITDVNNCVHRDSVKISIRPDAIFSLDAAAPVCLGNTVQLNASGGDTYSWQASPTLSNTGIPNPVASPGATETYFVTISESFCGHSETLSTTVRVNPLPTIRINKSNDIDCSYDRAQLSATGAAQYVWTPAGTLSNPSIANPVATPTATTDYTVTATDLNGCTNTGTVTVKVQAINEGQYLMANGFTPNGDGLNDCYGVKLWGIIQEIEFSIYNRWGERIFYSTQPGACWDGVYKGVKQDSGVFVYMVKAKTNCAPSVFRKGTFVLIR